MQCFVNNPSTIVDDMLAGFVKSHACIIAPTRNPRVLRYKKAPIAGKVGVVTGGGSGHKPAFIGYLGRNMVDAVAVGEIFSSPTAQAFADAFAAADCGKGVACLYGNYAGDIMNVKMAIKMAEAQGIKVKTVVANDDVPSAPLAEREKRRGVAGEVLMWKTAGARATQGASLNEVIATAQKAIDNTRSVGVGLAPCTIPEVGKPNFSIDEGCMEFGIGHHGEPGVRVEATQTAEVVATQMVETILADKPLKNSDEVVVVLSGLGATPVMELYVLYNTVESLLAKQGIRVYTSYVGNYFTSLDMKGATLTLMQLDEELKPLIDMEAHSVGLTQFQR